MAQLDALGPTAIFEQLNARGSLMGLPKDAHDLDAQIASIQDQLRLLRQPEVAVLPALKKMVGSMTRQQFMIQDRESDISKLHYLQTLSIDSLASYGAKIRALFGPVVTDMLNVPAPPLHCDYYFPTPQAATPLAGPVPPIPAQGQLSLLIFNDGQNDQTGSASVARRLHAAIPRLAITVVSHTTSGFAGQFLVAQPEQAAMLQHQYLVDSLGMPGAFCVTTTHYHMTAEGHAIPSPDPNIEAYHVRGSGFMIAVSQRGTTLNNDFVSLYDDLEWFLKRLDEKYGAGTPSSPGQP
jgi:hypothetical protein